METSAKTAANVEEVAAVLLAIFEL